MRSRDDFWVAVALVGRGTCGVFYWLSEYSPQGDATNELSICGLAQVRLIRVKGCKGDMTLLSVAFDFHFPYALSL